MPGLDHSDLIAFLRVIDAPPSDIAVRAAGFIETVQDKIKGYEAHITTVPEDRLIYDRPIKRCEELLVRLNSADPWAYWPYLPDEYLHGSAAWAGQGYWQGFFEDTVCRFSLIERQWNGSGIASSVTVFGFHRLREKFAIWSMAHWWNSVGHHFCGERLPGHFRELNAIMTDEWWDRNLAGIAWGGGIGKPESEQEARMYDMRAHGYSWERACRTVYHGDTFTASMIARYLEGWEAKGFTKMSYGHDKRAWPPVTIT
jgi:hypothetical protein